MLTHAYVARAVLIQWNLIGVNTLKMKFWFTSPVQAPIHVHYTPVIVTSVLSFSETSAIVNFVCDP